MTGNEVPTLHWHILGAGSIGCLWGTKLAIAGNRVTLILKDTVAAEAFRDAPLRLESDAGVHRPPVAAVQAAALTGGISWLLVTTKSFATLDALASVERHFTVATRIVILQNGMGVQQQVARQYPELTVIAGTTTDGAFRKRRFTVVHAGRGLTRFGALSPITAAEREEFLASLGAVDLDSAWADDIATHLWHKVAINSCINALTALRDCRNGALLESEENMATIRGLVQEAEAVMQAAGIRLPEPGLYHNVVEVLRATAANFSSMQQDFTQGRRTEIDAINGFICDQGRAFHVPTPVNYRLLNTVLTARHLE